MVFVFRNKKKSEKLYIVFKIHDVLLHDVKTLHVFLFAFISDPVLTGAVSSLGVPEGISIFTLFTFSHSALIWPRNIAVMKE